MRLLREHLIWVGISLFIPCLLLRGVFNCGGEKIGGCGTLDSPNSHEFQALVRYQDNSVLSIDLWPLRELQERTHKANPKETFQIRNKTLFPGESRPPGQCCP